MADENIVLPNDRLEALLIEGLDSGDPILLDAEEWSRIRAEVAEKLGQGQSAV